MGQDDEDNHAASLPDDLLADILGRLAPRWLAVSRCVCKAWQATVDARRLLRTDMLPLRLEGIFLYFSFHKFPEFFSRPGSPVSGDMDFLPYSNQHIEDDRWQIQDHRNGLLLLQSDQTGVTNYVVNPATRRWDSLPKDPPTRVMGVDCWNDLYLVYDPMVSPHYEVFTIPYVPWKREDEHRDPLFEESAWPPAKFILNVFSSRTRRWEPRPFDRQGGALGTIAEMRARGKVFSCWWRQRGRAVDWRGTLYVHCDKNFLMRITLSNGVFHAIELPEGAIPDQDTQMHLGRSEKGVYFASLNRCCLRVWILDESYGGKMECMLKHEHHLVLPCRNFGHHGPWVLQDTNYNFFRCHFPYFMDGNKEAISDEENFEWSSDDDYGCVANRDMAQESYSADIVILGFHPFKEIIFLLLVGKKKTPLAYHYNSLKAQVLGNVHPTDYDECFLLPNSARTIEGFPYVPCWLEEIPTNT